MVQQTTQLNEMENTARRVYAQTIGTLAKMSTGRLLDLWDATEQAPMSDELPTVRGWIMDALQLQNPLAYDEWMSDESVDANPRQYFAA